MQFNITSNVNLRGLEQFGKAVNEQLHGVPGPIRNAIKLWAVRYRSFAQIRFDLYSKGGGDWQKLALSTIKKRRQGTKSNVLKLRQIQQNITATPRRDPVAGVYSILRDTGLLFGALSPIFQSAPGAIEDDIPFGVRVGYGGPQRYTIGDKQSVATIADIAEFHQEGDGTKLPQRKIIVDPPTEVLEAMANDMESAMKKIAAQ